MNKERAINILLEHASRSLSNDDSYAPNRDSITAAILFLEQDRNKNKKNSNIEIKGIGFDVRKGL
jgi:hypothetical protein